MAVAKSKLQKSKLNTEKIKNNQNNQNKSKFQAQSRAKVRDFLIKPIQNAKSCGIISAGEKMDKQILIDNIELVHTTEMGIDRIKRNLKLDTNDVVEYCKQKVLDKNCRIYRQGKNWYCEIEDIVITINAYSYTIITAHKIK